MFWIILLLLLTAACFMAPKFIVGTENTTVRKICRFAGAFFTFLTLIVTAFTCSIEIPSGNVGVKSTFGEIEDTPLYPGLNFVAPWQSVVLVSTQTQSIITGEGGLPPMEVLSLDGLEVKIDQTLLYRINPQDAPSILRNIGPDYASKIVIGFQRSVTREESSKYLAVDLYAVKREEYQSHIKTSMTAQLEARKIVLEEVLLREINLPPSVKQTIEGKINAEQESQKMQFTLAKERQEAERKRVEAQGIADYQRIITSTLTPELLRYEEIKARKELALSNNAKVLIMGQGNTPVILGGQ